MALHDTRIVLVRPHFAANIGATARAMRNFGFRQLVLVAPVADPLDVEARKLSTHGESLLHAARIVGDLGEALADCTLVAATSARLGGLFRKQTLGPPWEIMPRLVASQPAALVFGPEPTGLTNDEVSRCHYLIHIPAEADYPALNLSQAVTVCLYELRRAWQEQSAPAAPPVPVAPFADQERMFAHLRQALEAVHFLYGPKADSLMHAVRHLIARAGPSAAEVDLLFGLARQLRWHAEHGKPPGDGASDQPA